MLKVKGRKTEMIPKGLLFFPVTPFQTDQSLNLPALKQHLEIGLNYEPGGLFVGCGAGEFHALSENEILAVIKIAVETNKGRVPLYIGAGGQIQVAKNISAKAQDLGADGLLVFPPYMATPSDEGLLRYFDELSCASSLQLIAYNRLGTVLTAELIRGLLNIKTVIGIKDGFGDFNKISEMIEIVSDWEISNPNDRKITFMNGTPTAEICAVGFRELGITTYSSAVLSFAPIISSLFYKSLIKQNDVVVRSLLDNFYIPLARIRDEIAGGAISIMKAGCRINGFDYGGVRAPYLDLSEEQTMRLTTVIKKGTEIATSLKEM